MSSEIEPEKPRSSSRKPIWVWVAGIIFLALFITGYSYYKRIYGANILADTPQKQYLYIPDGSDLIELVKNLQTHELLRSTADFEWAANFLHFKTGIKPGKYRLTDGMSNKQLIRKIQLGKQEPVDIILHSLRLKENLAAYVGKKIEADSMAIYTLLADRHYTDSLGYTTDNIYTMILPNTYRFKWNTSAKEFLTRMNRESARFWSTDKIEKARAIGLDKTQVIILASIVNQESNRVDEMPTIAGVYLNRLHRGVKLDADPTVIFANNDFSIKRVTRKYLIKDSPYNTYKYKGLPPGPITMPSLQAIEAVLNYQKSDYMFFCAKDDFSGHHAFAITREEHLINAHKFQKALDARNIH